MSSFINRILRTLPILLIPIILILGSARLLATDAYLALEYGKVSFPPDSYGFTQQQRFELASTNLHYSLAHLPSDTLANQTVDGKPVYSPREATHMVDVQTAFQSVLRTWQAAFILLLLIGFVLWRNGKRTALASALQSGGILTSGIILAIGLLALFAWQVWFDNFHLVFFEPGSWLFAYSDTLIRLFPLPFWVDATFTITAFSLSGGLLLAFAGRRWQFVIKKTSRRKSL